MLLQSIDAGREWKVAYDRTAKAVAARSPKPWNFDVSSVFNFVDAFKERCRCASHEHQPFLHFEMCLWPMPVPADCCIAKGKEITLLFAEKVY